MKLMEIKNNIIKFGNDRGRPYSENSIKVYLSNFNNLRKWCDGDDSGKWLKNHNKISEVLSSKKSNTQRNYYNAIIICMMAMKYDESMIKYYEGKRDILNAEYDKNKGTPTENQQKVLSSVKKEHILQMLVEMKKLIPGNRMEHMMYNIFRIHTQFPFRNELANIQIVNSQQYNTIEKDVKKTQNYILLDKIGKGKRKQDHSLTFTLNVYKTSKKYGEKSIPVEDKSLKMDLLTWMIDGLKLDINAEQTIPTYLITWASGNPLTRGDLSTLMAKTSSKWVGHSISTTLMAKLFSDIPEDGNTATKEEIEKAQKQANIRGHSLQVKTAIYDNPHKKLI